MSTKKEAKDSNGTDLGRVVSTHEYRDRKALVYNNREWSEFVVQFHEGGKHLEDADYHTSYDDYDKESKAGAKEDAQSTAKSWVAKAKNESAVSEPLWRVVGNTGNQYSYGLVRAPNRAAALQAADQLAGKMGVEVYDVDPSPETREKYVAMAASLPSGGSMEIPKGVGVAESASDIDAEKVEDMLDMSVDEARAEYDIDMATFAQYVDALDAGMFLYGGMPATYFGPRAMAFEGDLVEFETDAERNAYVFVAMAENGNSFDAVDSVDKFVDVPDYDADNVKQLAGEGSTKPAGNNEFDGLYIVWAETKVNSNGKSGFGSAVVRAAGKKEALAAPGAIAWAKGRNARLAPTGVEAAASYLKNSLFPSADGPRRGASQADIDNFRTLTKDLKDGEAAEFRWRPAAQ